MALAVQTVSDATETGVRGLFSILRGIRDGFRSLGVGQFNTTKIVNFSHRKIYVTANFFDDNNDSEKDREQSAAIEKRSRVQFKTKRKLVTVKAYKAKPKDGEGVEDACKTDKSDHTFKIKSMTDGQLSIDQKTKRVLFYRWESRWVFALKKKKVFKYTFLNGLIYIRFSEAG